MEGQELEETIKVLEKESSERTKNELSTLIYLTQDIPFFKEYRDNGQKEIHERCCAYMQYEFIREKQLVFELGSIGDKFYLLLNGKAEIHIKIGGQDGQQATLKCVKILEGGMGFGEMALLKNQPRLARIICQKDCYLATLDKESFVKILKQAEEDKLIKEMEFFAKMPIFAQWNFNLLKLLYLNTFRVKKQKGDFLFKEEQPCTAVYIVCQGEFTATKQFTQEISQDEECLQVTRQETLKFKKLQRDKSPTKVQRLVMWQPYELIGEDDIIYKRKRTYSVECTSVYGEVVMIKKYDFIQRVMWDDTSKKVILERLKIKDYWFNNKIDHVNKMMSSNEYASFYYNDMKIRNRIQGAIQESDPYLKEFVKVIENSLEQDTTLVRAQRKKRKAYSEDQKPHYSSKDIKQFNMPLHQFGDKAQNYQKMNKIEKEVMDEKAKKVKRQPLDIMDELVKKFHQSLKLNYYQHFKKGNYEQFQQMAQHINHQALKSLIIKDERTNPNILRKKNPGQKRQSSPLPDQASNKFGKLMLKIKEKTNESIIKDQSINFIQPPNELNENAVRSVEKVDFIDNEQLLQGVFIGRSQEQINKIAILAEDGNITNISHNLTKVQSSFNDQNQTINTYVRNESDNLETRASDSIESPQKMQRQKFYSVDSFTVNQESPKNRIEKRVSKNIARINNQIGQIARDRSKQFYEFQQNINFKEEQETDANKCAKFFILNPQPFKTRSKSREPYKFEVEKNKILQLTQPDLNKSTNSIVFDNKNKSTISKDNSTIIHSSNILPNKIPNQRQKIKILQRTNNFKTESNADISVQSIINKLNGENVICTKQIQQQQVRCISQFRNAKSYSSVNNNIIFQNKQNYSNAQVTSAIQIDQKQNTETIESPPPTEIKKQQLTRNQNFQSSLTRLSQSPLKLQKIINKISNQQIKQEPQLSTIN